VPDINVYVEGILVDAVWWSVAWLSIAPGPAYSTAAVRSPSTLGAQCPTAYTRGSS
jgi:hypothetical protein